VSNDFHVFTTMLVKNGKVKWLDEHLIRLREHAAHFGIAWPGDEFLRAHVLDRVTAGTYLLRPSLRHFNPCCHSVLDTESRAQPRNLTNTSSVMTKSDDGKTTLEITTRPINLPATSAQARIIISDIIIDKHFSHFKTSKAMPYLRARDFATTHSAFEALLLDDDGYVVDGSRSSPLLFRDGVLISLEGGLRGITREKVLEAARERGIPTARARLRPHELVGDLLVAGSGVGLVSNSTPQEARLQKLVDIFKIVPNS
jgi:4-amino-4-deoxychorismate lyase